MSLLNGNNRAVPDVPFYMSDALQEFMGAATGNISEAMLAAGVAVPGLVSQLGGLSASTGTHTLTVGFDHDSDQEEDIYGFYDGTDPSSPFASIGELTPLTLDIGGSSVVIHSITGYFNADNNDAYDSSITTDTFASYDPEETYYIDLTFASGETFRFNPAVVGTIIMWTSSPSCSNALKAANGQTISLTITSGITTWTTYILNGVSATGPSAADNPGNTWEAAGYCAEGYCHDVDPFYVSYGEFSPLTITTPTYTANILRLDGLTIGSSYTDMPAEILTETVESTAEPSVMKIKVVPKNIIYTFDNYGGAPTVWYERDFMVDNPSLFETLTPLNGETTEIGIKLSGTMRSAKTTYVDGLTPPGVTNSLYFIDPLMFVDTGEIRAYPTLRIRDAVAPLFNQEVTKPPANYYPGTHAYVDGEWVPK